LPAAITSHFKDRKIKFVYFVGYIKSAKGENYLQSIDSRDVPEETTSGLPLKNLIKTVDEASKGSSIIVVDAAPWPSAARGGQSNIAPGDFDRPDVLVAFSSGPGSISDGSENGENGAYAIALANALSVRSANVRQIFRDVRRTVREATRGMQLPITAGDLRTDLVLRAAATEEDVPGPENPGLDQILWHFTRESSGEAELNAFAQAFPKSPYAERALARGLRLATASQPGVGTMSRSVLSGSAAASSAAADQTDYVIATTGDRAPPKPLRTWPKILPKTPGGLAEQVQACDQAAADPDDPMRISPGVRWSLLNLKSAARECVFDLVREPTNRRLQFELGRTLDAAGLFAWAEYFYRQAAEKGYSAAISNLAYLYMTGRGREVNWGEAIRLLRQGAELGNPRARTDLGVAYLRGTGVERSADEALLWLKLAGSNGWPNAIDVMGTMYQDGNGVSKDESMATELFATAAWIGNTNAMVNLGRAYVDGRGIAQNNALGRMWLERSMAAGNPFAPFFLGEINENGNGVTKNTSRAAELFSLSANRGFGQARYRLGELYEKGQGVPADLTTAAFNYALADRQTFEIPVSADIISAAKGRLEAVRQRLSQSQRDAVEKRVRQWLELNGS
jgi:TPR repeat protein